MREAMAYGADARGFLISSSCKLMGRSARLTMRGSQVPPHTATTLTGMIVSATVDPLFPAGNVSDPVIRWIDKAITIARDLVRKKAPEDANDPYYILAAALTIIANTREHAVGKNHPYCSDMSLAYADHYLQMRVEAFNMGPKHRGFLEKRDRYYDHEKQVAKKHRALEWIMETGPCRMSPVTPEEKHWAKRGLEDGLKDYKNYPPEPGTTIRHKLDFLRGLI